MRRKDTKIFTGRIFPSDLKTTKPGTPTASVDWKNTSDRGESLSDPRWHKRPPTKDKQMKKTKLSPQYQPTAQVTDARDLITGSKFTKFPKITFGDTTIPTSTVTKRCSSQTTMPLIARSNIATQTMIQTEMEKEKSSTSTQTSSNIENDQPMEQETYVSRVDPNVCLQEETSHNVERPTMTTSLQLESATQ